MRTRSLNSQQSRKSSKLADHLRHTPISSEVTLKSGSGSLSDIEFSPHGDLDIKNKENINLSNFKKSEPM